MWPKFGPKSKLPMKQKCLSRKFQDTNILCHCGLGFVNEFGLEIHIKDIHEENKSYECVPCDKIFTSKQELDDHLDVIHKENMIKYTCIQCEAEFEEIERENR